MLGTVRKLLECGGGLDLWKPAFSLVKFFILMEQLYSYSHKSQIENLTSNSRISMKKIKLWIL